MKEDLEPASAFEAGRFVEVIGDRGEPAEKDRGGEWDRDQDADGDLHRKGSAGSGEPLDVLVDQPEILER